MLIRFQIHFVCLPGQCEGEEVTQQVTASSLTVLSHGCVVRPHSGARLPPQALSCLAGGLCELLRSVHIHGLKNDEVLLVKDSRRLLDAGTQVCASHPLAQSAR